MVETELDLHALRRPALGVPAARPLPRAADTRGYPLLLECVRDAWRDDLCDEALAFLADAIALQPNVPEGYRLRAALWAELGDCARAIDDLDLVIEALHAGTAADHMARAEAWLELGQQRRAERDLEEAVRHGESLRRAEVLWDYFIPGTGVGPVA